MAYLPAVDMPQSYESFVEGLSDAKRRRELLFRDGRPFFVLLSQQFQRTDLESLCDTATAIRRLDRHRDGRIFLTGLLRGHRLMNLFAQPSTRTAESFIAAADKLGATARLVSDLQTSSFAKGETVDDSVRTLSSFFDGIVTRHHDSDFATRCAWALQRSQRPIPVISAGSGKSQHVTQSLLDIYTLRYSFADRGGLDGKTIAIVGDVGRNRAARSLAYLLTRFENCKVHFVSPQAFRPDDALLANLKKHGIETHMEDRLEDLLQRSGGELDAIYMTRLQKEWDSGGTQPKGDIRTDDNYVLRHEYRRMISSECVIMHPLPRVNELPEEWEDHPGLVVWRQVRNGMWMRAALFATVYGADEEICARARRLELI